MGSPLLGNGVSNLYSGRSKQDAPTRLVRPNPARQPSNLAALSRADICVGEFAGTGWPDNCLMAPDVDHRKKCHYLDSRR
jgi:hypothetical protein